MNPDDLLAIARDLLRRDAGKPKQASLKRAVSTAYYALFHLVCHEVVDRTTGWRFQSPRYWDLVQPLYRLIDHAQLKRCFDAIRRDSYSSPELKRIARTFVDLQAARIAADYNPKPDFKRSSAAQLVEEAAEAIATFRRLPLDARRDVVMQVLAKPR